MKYVIQGIYYSTKKTYPPIVEEWGHDIAFEEYLMNIPGVNKVSGNWEDGWGIFFDCEKQYTLFLLKWGSK